VTVLGRFGPQVQQMILTNSAAISHQHLQRAAFFTSLGTKGGKMQRKILQKLPE
jgi:hypothetical protein